MACNSCGAKRGHLDGCPAASGSSRSKKKKSPGHQHEYMLMRQTDREVPGRGKVTYRYWKCINRGCPRPDVMTINEPNPPA